MCCTMKTVEFLVKEFPDGRLMSVIIFRGGKNFRIHRNGNDTYYSWCYHEDDLRMALKIYQAVNRFNMEFKKKMTERREALNTGVVPKPFYT